MKIFIYLSFLSILILFSSCSSSVYNVEVSDIKEINDFHEELAGVLVGEYWGFINPKGDFVIEHQYRDIKQFNEKLAAVKLNTKWGFIDKKGDMVIPAQYDDTRAFNESFAPVKKDGKWGFIKTNGKTKIDFQFEDAMPFSDGLAAVKVNGLWGYIKTNGDYKIEPKYRDAGAFKNGLAPVNENGLYGYINSKGDYEINPIYVSALSYSAIKTGSNYVQYLAAVNLDGNWGYIDMSGDFIINPKYDAALPFTEEVAWVKTDYKWGLIDRKDNVLIEFNYVYAGMFSSGLSAVVHNGKKFYVDKKGKDAGILKITANNVTGNVINNLNNSNSVVLTPSVGSKCAIYESVLGIYNFLDNKILLECEGCYYNNSYDRVILEPKSTYIPISDEFSKKNELSDNITLSVYTYDTMHYLSGNPQGTTVIKNVSGNRKHLLLAAPQGIYTSNYYSINWVKSDDGIKSAPNGFAFSGELAFAATMSGVFASENYGKSSWKPFGLEDEYVSNILSYKDLLFASTPDGLYSSKTNKAGWDLIYTEKNGYPSLYYLNDTIAYILVNGKKILYSDSGFKTWNEIESPSHGSNISDILLVGNKLFVSLFSSSFSSSNGVYFSTNFGKDWQKSKFDNSIWDLVYFDNRIFASGNGVFVSEDKGINWKIVYLPEGLNIKYNMSEIEGGVVLYDGNKIYQIPGTKKIANINYYTEIINVYFGVPPFGHFKHFPLAHLKIQNLVTGISAVLKEKYETNDSRISSASINALFTQAGDVNIWAQALNMPQMGVSACSKDFFQYEKDGWNNPMTVIIEDKNKPYVPKY